MRGGGVKGGGPRGGVKGCGVKAAKAASQATSSDRALLPCWDTLTLYTRCVKSHFSLKNRGGGQTNYNNHRGKSKKALIVAIILSVAASLTRW